MKVKLGLVLSEVGTARGTIDRSFIYERFE
jgi:hypothetical protein